MRSFFMPGRLGGLALMAAASLVLAPGALQTKAIEAAQQSKRPGNRARRQHASTLAYPRLNRARRHPPALSYGHAAEISFALCFRTSGVR